VPFFENLERAVSNPRIERYRPQNGSDLEVAVNYFWNISLCEALYPCLNALEITLRNSIHVAATAAYSSEFWFDTGGVLILKQPGQVQAARKKVRDRKRSPTAGRIIAELHFGFWTTLLSDPYHSSFWMSGKARMLKEAFPNMINANRVRSDIHRRYDTQRYLRNRVFHFEPIWDGVEVPLQQVTTILNVRDMHDEAVEAIGWISPTTRDGVLAIDHFDDTYHNGKARIEAALRQRFNLS
jgi:hypothetical protein